MATASDKVGTRKEIMRNGVDSKRYVVWSAALEEKLLTLWRSRRCLFDPNSLVSKSERQEALVQLAAEMGVSEEDLTKHMTSLRTQYSRCMRSGSTIATTHRQKWLVRKLAFLKPYIKKRLRMSTNFNAARNWRPSGQYSYVAYDKLIEDAFSGHVESEAVAASETAAVVDDVDNNTSIDLELLASDGTVEDDDDSQSVLARNDAGLECPDEEPESAPPAPSTTWRAAGGRRLDDDDDDAVFGQLVVCELRHISDADETKLLLRHNILTMIYEARLDCLQRRARRHLSPWPSLRRLDRADRRPFTRPTVNGYRRARSTRDDIDSAGAPVLRDNAAVDNDSMIVIKEEIE